MVESLGHNNPPLYDADVIAEFDRLIAEFGEATGEWTKALLAEGEDAPSVKNADQAARLNDMIAGARKLHQEVDAARKKEKEPHLSAGREVDAAFNRRLARLDRIADELKPLMKDWLVREHKRIDAERAAAARQAQEERDRAAELHRQAAARGDVIGEADAEQAQKEAEVAMKAAERAGRAQAKSATGGTRAMALRQRPVARIDNVRLAFMHFQDREEVVEVLRTLAQREAVAAKGQPLSIPGVTITFEEIVA